MKKLLLCASATLFAVGLATAASADSSETGTVTITGDVPAQCSIVSIPGGTQGAGVFADTVNIDVGGTIADANSHLLNGLHTSTNANAPVNLSYQINCNGANNHVTLSATPMTTTGFGSVSTGDSGTVTYTAEADFAVVPTNTVTLTDNLTTSTTNSPQNFGAGVRLANQAANLIIKAYAFDTPGGQAATDILIPGAYSGVITVFVSAGT